MVYSQTPREKVSTPKKQTEVTTESLMFTMPTMPKIGIPSQSKVHFRRSKNKMLRLSKKSNQSIN